MERSGDEKMQIWCYKRAAAFCVIHHGMRSGGLGGRCSRGIGAGVDKRACLTCNLNRRGSGLNETELVKSNGVAKDTEGITRRNLIIGVGVSIGVGVLATIPSTPNHTQSTASSSSSSSSSFSPQPLLSSINNSKSAVSLIAGESDQDLFTRVLRVIDALRLIESSLQNAELSAQQSCAQAASVRLNYSLDAALFSLVNSAGANQTQATTKQQQNQLADLAANARETLSQLQSYFDARELASESLTASSIKVRQEQVRVISGALLTCASILERFTLAHPSRNALAAANQLVTSEKQQEQQDDPF